ncbi:TetR/AcrR family transcriptional regulator [Tsukamurella sp. 8F]|uniref:TetR/AcrR family transcriptional regulator n=1 Tax=unclassified Tsukamurella TaxID=2633480 RepID=UPI0023B967FE|nr:MULTISPECIES: TetR/AcrR family transcriptional regulator [unclassified Tsukamurella]MDF0530208.1 TetR/AcrR family transcriptional regulator [Tsukamurella sp. 8J]MDF0586525.1 TetR/AcrR family transcriptional regulator [Tsukamurella sp. 8F]
MNTNAPRTGRPRSEAARAAVLYAVDDLLVEQGYAAMTLKGIAERAGVSRQTIYRWWSTKAEILFEASWIDAAQELSVPPGRTPLAEVTSYLEALVRFLSRSDAGAAYRALLGEAQHDPAVAQLLGSRDLLGDSARVVIERVVGPGGHAIPVDQASALLVGPVFYWILSGQNGSELDVARSAERFLGQLDVG